MITLSVNLIKAILKFACKDDVRSPLCGIHFDPAGAAVATDGHTLVAVKVPAGVSGTVRTRDLLAACRAAGAGGSVRIAPGGDGLPWALTALAKRADRLPGDGPTVATMTAHLVPANFPAWRQIIPEVWREGKMSESWPSVDPKFLARLEGLAEAISFNRHGRQSVKLSAFGGELDPLRYDIDGMATVVIMPMRSENAPARWPE